MASIRRLLRSTTAVALLAGLLTPLATASPAQAVVLPTGFSEQVVFSGLSQPMNIEFAPDGRVFVAEKGGRIKVFDNLADTTATVFADLSTNVHNQHDRGLLGLALHPDFPTQPWVYVLYTYDAPPGQTAPVWNDDCSAVGGANGGRCVVTGRLSRLQAAGNVMTGSEQVLLHDWCQQYPSHSIGDLRFGPDGALYVSSGDGASFSAVDYGQLGSPANPCGDPPGGTMTPPSAQGGALRSQDVRTLADPTGLDGTILRLNPTTGEAAAGNPLIASPDLGARRIVAQGLRNPFRFTFRPGASELWLGDVGWNTWEEVNRLTDPASAVRNFGWPCYEGTARQGGYDGANLTLCEDLYAGAGQTAPYYAYHHSSTVVTGETCPTGSSSVSGAAFHPATGGSYPAAYAGALFFSDYSRRCIWAMLPSTPGGPPDPANRITFAADANNPVDLATGPGGDLYFADAAGFVRRIRYSAGNQAPTAVIQASPTSGTAPLTVTFDGRASSDPDPADAGLLRHEWDFTNDGTVDATTPTATYTYPAGGPYTARLRVVDTSGAAGTATVSIQTGNTAPTAVIDSPAASLTFAVGDTISFAGRGTDPQQGNLPASALNWRLIQHHCAATGSCHEHVVRDWAGVASGSFPAPDHDYPSYLELVLTATDAGGLTHTSSVRLNPRTVQLTFATNPPGLQVAVGSEAATTPFTRTVIQRSANSVSAITPQTVDGVRYEFVGWSDGGAQTHVITAPTTATTYTATYARRLPQSQMSVRSVSSQETLLLNGRGTRVLDGSASTIWSSRILPRAQMPHEIQLDLGASRSVSRLYYLPRQTNSGRIAAYEVYVSTDGTTWGTPVATGTFPNSAAEQTVAFAARAGRYVRLRATSAIGGGATATAAELNVGVLP